MPTEILPCHRDLPRRSPRRAAHVLREGGSSPSDGNGLRPWAPTRWTPRRGANSRRQGPARPTLIVHVASAAEARIVAARFDVAERWRALLAGALTLVCRNDRASQRRQRGAGHGRRARAVASGGQALLERTQLPSPRPAPIAHSYCRPPREHTFSSLADRIDLLLDAVDAGGLESTVLDVTVSPLAVRPDS